MVSKSQSHLRHRYSLLRTCPKVDVEKDVDYFPDGFPSLFGNIPWIPLDNNEPIPDSFHQVFPQNVQFAVFDITADDADTSSLGPPFDVIIWYDYFYMLEGFAVVLVKLDGFI